MLLLLRLLAGRLSVGVVADDGILVNAELYFPVNLDKYASLLDLGYGAVDAACGDDLVRR